MCVFTDKKYIKRSSYVLVPLIAINTFVGCARVDETTLRNDENQIGIEIIQETEEPRELFEETVSTVVTDDSEVSKVESALDRLSSVFGEANSNIDTILNISDRNSEIYAGALYAKAKSYGLSDEIILRELENVICFGTQAMCIDEETWMELFGNLVGTISIYDNVIDYYYPLASYVHRYSCTLEHEPLFFDENRVTCENIEKMYEEKNPTIDFVAYVSDLVLASNDESLINKFNKIVNSGVNVEEALYELDSVYYLSAYPTDLSEELWNQLFSNLMKTINTEENVCSVYYDLSYYVHSLLCDLEHSINEDGKYECVDESITLKK